MVPAASADTRRLPLALAVVLTVAAVALQVTLFLNGGALWRDEVNSVATATAPTVPDLFQRLVYDSAPPLFFLLVRGWATAFGGDDTSLRALGMAAGLLTLAALWAAAEQTRGRPPLLSLALIGLNPALIRWGGSVRPYGLAAALGVAAFVCFWRYSEQPSRRRLALAALVAVLGVQCAYQNAVLVAAAGGAAVLVCLRNGRRRAAWAAVGVGAVSALSLTPSLWAVRERVGGWNQVIQHEVALGEAVFRVGAAAAGALPWARWIWLGLLVASLLAAGRAYRRGTADRDLRLFAAAGVLGAALGTSLLLLWLGYVVQPWHVLPLLAFAAAGLEAAADWPGRRLGQRLAFAGGCLLLGSLQAVQGAAAARTRFTSVDQVAARLTRRVGPDDLVVVSPWYCAISFGRYYRGGAPLETIPPLPDHSTHRYDLVAAAMRTPDPLAPLLERVEGTLSSGHRVFWVRPRGRPPAGSLASPPPGQPWDEGRYGTAWAGQLEAFLARHAVARREAPADAGLVVDHYEDLGFVIASGWRPQG